MTTPCRALRQVARAALLTGVAALGTSSLLGAQSMRAGGSIGVSLTILPPVRTEPIRVVGFDVDRSGLVTLLTTAPSAASGIVMSRLIRESASESNEPRDTSLVPWKQSSASVRHEIQLVAPRNALSGQTLRLRLRYLTVPGT